MEAKLFFVPPLFIRKKPRSLLVFNWEQFIFEFLMTCHKINQSECSFKRDVLHFCTSLSQGNDRHFTGICFFTDTISVIFLSRTHPTTGLYFFKARFSHDSLLLYYYFHYFTAIVLYILSTKIAKILNFFKNEKKFTLLSGVDNICVRMFSTPSGLASRKNYSSYLQNYLRYPSTDWLTE